MDIFKFALLSVAIRNVKIIILSLENVALTKKQSASHVMTFPSCYNELQRHFSYDGVLGKHMYYGSHVPSNFLYTDSMQTNNENRDRIKGTKNFPSCTIFYWEK